MSIIRTSKHKLSYTNKEKMDSLSAFIDEYRRVATLIIKDIWENGHGEFNISHNKLDFPKYIDYKSFNIDTFLSARALSSLATQVSGMIRAETEKQRKRLYTLEQNKIKRVSRSKKKVLIKRIKQNVPRAPSCFNINPELSSKCINWENSSGKFDGFLQLRSIVKDRKKINLPIKFNTQSSRLINKGGKLMGSFLISKNFVELRWEFPDIAKKENGNIIGADQGFKDVLTLSNKQVTKHQDIHGHSLESIIDKMSRKTKGSKAFGRVQKHRKNFINWSINQLNFSDIKELRLEQVENIKYKNKTSRKLSHWNNPLIRDKVESICEENGVRLIYQSSTYRSQRCSGCGVVRKANRKGKVYSCKHCGLELDADYNAALNHEANLPDIPYTLRKAKVNRGDGFYWLENGFYDFSTGTSLESVPSVEPSVTFLS